MNRRKPYWVDQDADPLADQDVTEANREFLEHYRTEMMHHKHHDSSVGPLLIEQSESRPWIPQITQRCGLIAIKLGVYPLWTKTGRKLECTVLQVNACADDIYGHFC